MGRITNTKELMELFGVTRRTIVRWSGEADFPPASRETPYGPNFWDLAAVKEWAVENDFWDEVVDMPTRRRRRSYDRSDIHGRRMRHGHDCVGCMEARQRHHAANANRKQGSDTATEQGENVTSPGKRSYTHPADVSRSASLHHDNPSTFVLVKEAQLDPGTYGVLSQLASSEGLVKMFAPQFDADQVVQYATRQASIDDAREYGGVPHTFTAGRELLEIGPPTYLIDPSGIGVGLI